MIITKNKLFIGISFFCILANYLVFLNVQFLYLRAIFSFLLLTIVPGFLIFKMLRIQIQNIWESLIYVVGLSMGFLMFSGLFANWFLPLLGVKHPLSLNPIVLFIDVFIYFLYVIAYFTSKNSIHEIHFSKPKLKEIIVAGVPVIFPILSILGAVSINNSGSDMFTMIVLGGIAIYTIIIFSLGRFLNSNVFPWIIYLFGLSLLFMTSLRGWYITGHDVQQEFYVFQLTKKEYIWSISTFKDAYNACLSINILPTIYYSFLNIKDIYIFKIIFQIIFSLAPVGVYLLLKRYTTPIVALLSTFFFITFPTFGQDMPMLNRQEIGLFYFILMLLTLFNKKISKKFGIFLFTILGCCMIVSHYSTSYIAITLFGVTYLLTILFKRFKFLFKFRIGNGEYFLSWISLTILILFTIIWNSQLDQSHNGLVKIITETAKNISQSFGQNSKSVDVSYSIFNWRKTDRNKVFTDYVNKVGTEIETGQNENQFYTKDQYEKPKVSLIEESVLPLSKLGTTLKKMGIDPFTLNNLYKQLAPKVIQLFLVIGFISILLKKSKFINNIDSEYIVMLGVGIILLGLFTVVPVLSVEYGVFRFFYQALIIMALPAIIGPFTLLFFVNKRIKLITTMFFYVIFFLSFSGFTSQLTGGYYPLLILNNSGLRYDCLYSHDSEISSLKWLGVYVSNYDIQSIQANQCMYFKILNISGLDTYEQSVLPSTIKKDGYVYLNYSNVKTGNNIIYINNNPYIYNIPMDFLNENKNLIYNNNETKIYK